MLGVMSYVIYILKKSDVSEADGQNNETRHIRMGLSENVSVSTVITFH